ncbi:hypothetical protein [Streptomyces lavendofoliae]|uniref:Uncharacterized protein n=1 Tax=Streptomyces lavendofoliae TaxID=67314 RepID=A0A918I025_9ACTN|nr:hypothetical protein [Streptomyces lavendofoliae]GGU48390.1 hypothetical protein GCM10010274_41360 [Streptomyces lavendofoliae]
MDLESVAEELYGLRPDRFTAARDARAAEARKAGDRVLADAVRSLRRPTLAAWVSNLLVRERPDEARSLAALGDGLRRAHHELDGERLRELSRQQHAVVTALARQARQLAADAGQPVGDPVQHEVEATLHAVLADPAAAGEWAAGRLVKPLSAPVGFDAALTDVSPERQRRRGADGREKAPDASPERERGKPERNGERKEQEERGRERDERAERERERREREERAERERRALREELRRAEEAARAREEERDRARADEERAREGLREAARRVEELAAGLEEAERARRTADEGVRAARRRSQEAERAAREARRQARDTAARTGRRGTGA